MSQYTAQTYNQFNCVHPGLRNTLWTESSRPHHHNNPPGYPYTLSDINPSMYIAGIRVGAERDPYDLMRNNTRNTWVQYLMRDIPPGGNPYTVLSGQRIP